MTRQSIPAGELDQRVSFFSPLEIIDPVSGEVTQNGNFEFDRWAKVEPTGGAEREVSDELLAEQSHKVTLHYTPEIQNKWWLTWGTTRLDVVAELDIAGARTRTVLLCKESPFQSFQIPPLPAGPALLQEQGDGLLQEQGDALLQESP
ncbi:MAG: phage head closure protein [Burkholderiales bacterium]|nr:phage head closure protein [Burkholderiales bacterium]